MPDNQDVVRAASVEPSASRYLHQKGVMLGLPISGTFELTSRCNFNCRMCYVHDQKNPKQLKENELTADQWLSLASDARDAGMVFLLLTGGEPFIREDFPEIYTELIKMGLMVSINTNGSLLTPALRDLFYQYPPTRFNISLYGGSEETYSNLCGNASFEKVVNTLRMLKQDEHQVRLNVSLTPYNVQDMKSIDSISREIGLQAKAAAYMYPPVRIENVIGENAGRFEAQEAGRVMAEWHYLRDTPEMFQNRVTGFHNMGSADVIDSCIDTDVQEGVRCRAGRCSFWMTWDGRMLPCGTMETEPSWPMRDGFTQAWEEVKKRTAAIRMPAKCTNCIYKNNCGVCAANCKGETGSFSGCPEYLCTMTKSMGNHMACLAEGDSKK